MKILLDENVSHVVIGPLRRLGHEVESINTLKQKGLDNGTLYREVAQSFDVCFTRDAGFAAYVKKAKTVSACKVLHIVIPQLTKSVFLQAFMAAFREIEWTRYANGDDWPR